MAKRKESKRKSLAEREKHFQLFRLLWLKVTLGLYTDLKNLRGKRERQGLGDDGGGRGWRDRETGGKEEKGFSVFSLGQMVGEWRPWSVVSAVRTRRNAFLFFALSQRVETQTSAVKQWIKSCIPSIISL